MYQIETADVEAYYKSSFVDNVEGSDDSNNDSVAWYQIKRNQKLRKYGGYYPIFKPGVEWWRVNQIYPQWRTIPS